MLFINSYMSKIFVKFTDRDGNSRAWPSDYSEYTDIIERDTFVFWTGNRKEEHNFHFVEYSQLQGNLPYNVIIQGCESNPNLFREHRYIIDEIVNSKSNEMWLDQLKQDSENGLVHYYINQAKEKHIVLDRDKFWWSLFHLVEALGCKNHPQNIHLITGASQINPEVKFIQEFTGISVHTVQECDNFLKGYFYDYTPQGYSIKSNPEYELFVQNTTNSINKLETRKYQALTYNRVPRPMRSLLLAELERTDKLDQTLYSWGNEIKNIFNENDMEPYGKIYENLKEGVTKWYNRPPVYIKDEVGKISLAQNQADWINLYHPQECNFKIVTETCYNDLAFITEKSMKAFVSMLPFIMLGPAFNVEVLRDNGYRVYDNWIDHSYDKHRNFENRWYLFTSELNRLYNISKEEWASMRKEMLPDMLYNLEIAKSRTVSNCLHIFK